MKKISVIISAYNAREFIADAIKSILAQKLPPNYGLELIIGVDGCQKTWDVVPQMRHQSIKYVKMAYNYGPYITFNTLMKFATGHLIARFDADDVMLPDYLFKQIYLLDNFSNIGITRTWSIYTDENFSPIPAKITNGNFTLKDGKRRACSDGQLVMRRDVWNALGSYKPWPCSADTDFIDRAKLINIPFYELKDFLFARRIHKQSLTQKKETGHGSPMRELFKVIRRRDLMKHISEKNFYVKPTLGYIEKVI
jgi:glycosyltransferase involved in cell wall biosynthesis